MSVKELLLEVSIIKLYPEYPPMIENLLEYLSSNDKNLTSAKINMSNKILNVIRKTSNKFEVLRINF